MQMGPMIDMVFLLLVFFMVSAKPVKEESDIQIGLPGKVEQSETIEMPDEQRIIIAADGSVILNELPLGAPGDRKLRELEKTLTRFRESSEANRTKALVTLVPDAAVGHQRVVDVLNTCAVAKIRGVTFDTAAATGSSDDF